MPVSPLPVSRPSVATALSAATLALLLSFGCVPQPSQSGGGDGPNTPKSDGLPVAPAPQDNTPGPLPQPTPTQPPTQHDPADVPTPAPGVEGDGSADDDKSKPGPPDRSGPTQEAEICPRDIAELRGLPSAAALCVDDSACPPGAFCDLGLGQCNVTCLPTPENPSGGCFDDAKCTCYGRCGAEPAAERDQRPLPSLTFLMMRSTQPWRETNGPTTQFRKQGGYSQALADFYRLAKGQKIFIKEKDGHIIRYFQTQERIWTNVRPHSRDGSATLEVIPLTSRRYKFRYDK